MSGTQRLLAALFPNRAAEMEAESRRWIVTCPHCGHLRSIWDLGGIRWKAAGNPRRYLPCPQCGRSGWHAVTRRQENGPAGS